METEYKQVTPRDGSLRDELIITQEVIQGLLEMLGAAWEEADHMRAMGNNPVQPR